MAGLYDEQILGAKRRAETARKLREESMGQAPQGQMIGRYYVSPHWTQALAHGIRQYMLGSQEREATQEAEDLQRQQAQSTIQALNQAGMSAPETLLKSAQSPVEQPGFMDKAVAFLRGEEMPQAPAPTPIQQNIAKDLTPEQRDQAYMHLMAVNPEMGKNMLDYMKLQSEMDSKSMRRARAGVPQGFDINENGELVPMQVAGGGDYLSTVLPLQAQARGGYVNPVQQHQMSVSDAQLQLQMMKDAREARKEAQQEETSQKTATTKQWELENPNAQKNLAEIEAARSANQKLQDTLSSYKDKLSKAGKLDLANPFGNADIQTAHQAATWPIRSETMMNTGVLNPGEMGMLNKALTDPTSVRGLAIGKDQILKQIDEIKRISDENTNAIIKSRKPATPPGMENSPYWKDLNKSEPKPEPSSGWQIREK